MKKCITVIMLLLTFSLVDLYAQNKSSPYITLVSLSKISVGYEYVLSARWATSIDIGYVIALTKSHRYSWYPVIPLRMLNTKGIQTNIAITYYTKNSKNLFSLKAELNYQKSNVFIEKSDWQVAYGNHYYEFKEVYLNYGIFFSYAYRYNKNGRFCIVLDTGIEYQNIKRYYSIDGFDPEQYHYYSNRVESLYKLWPIANIGLRFYFRKLN